MDAPQTIHCDGCGQAVTHEHIARRLKRLEKMTRYRPIHVQALFLGAASPCDEADDLYSAEGEFRGEGADILRALGIEKGARSIPEVLTEVQKQGLLFTHVLDCPVNGASARREAIERRLPGVLARIRRSYKPKRLVLVNAELAEFVTEITAANFDAMIVLNNGQPYEWAGLSVQILAKEAAMPTGAL